MRTSGDYAKRAEVLIDRAGDQPDITPVMMVLAEAQVNATLAQAAAICELIEVLRPQVERERAK